ncbi:hypothetical protein AX279_08455 [Pseudomonas sp. J237]|nr:hypothetical protein AX279_08455 [Pseudomonas sp. J237]
MRILQRLHAQLRQQSPYWLNMRPDSQPLVQPCKLDCLSISANKPLPPLGHRAYRRHMAAITERQSFRAPTTAQQQELFTRRIYSEATSAARGAIRTLQRMLATAKQQRFAGANPTNLWQNQCGLISHEPAPA